MNYRKTINQIIIFFKSNLLLLLISLVSLCIQLIPLFNTEYGYFRDEFYYLACAKNLAFGYVDHPPFSIYILRIFTLVFGNSLFVIRIIPALAGSAAVFFTGSITKKLGGKIFAQILSMTGIALSTGLLSMCSFYSMNSIEIFLWTIIIYLIITLVQKDEPKLFIIIGILIGFGLLNKHTLIIFAVSLLLGILFTPSRKYLINKWFWIGILSCLLIFLPNIIWQAVNNFPSLEFYKNAQAKGLNLSPLKVIMSQLILMNPFFFPLWLMGLIYFIFSKKYRVFSILYLIVLLIMILTRSSRPDRMIALYTVLFAGGGILAGNILSKIKFNLIKRSAQIFIITIITVSGLFFTIFAIPVLPVKYQLKYYKMLGVSVNIEKGKPTQFPQWIADRFGWQELAQNTAIVYNKIPEDKKEKTMIIAANYGEAGALQLYSEKYNFPPVISPHNNYYYWGKNHNQAETYIIIGVPPEQLNKLFNHVEQAGIHSAKYVRSHENNLPIYICENPVVPININWDKMKWFGSSFRKINWIN